MRRILPALLASALCLPAGCATVLRAVGGAGPDYAVTFEGLLGEMNDLERLAYPANYRLLQFSSYDRASERGDEFANGDLGHYLRREGKEWVLAEAFGPGAVVRIWSANPSGRLKIILDGAVVVEEDFRGLLAGEVKPFFSPFAAVRASGGNLYLPLPFQKSMKVTCSRGGQYYHVAVRKYPPETRVKTITKGALADFEHWPILDLGERPNRIGGPRTDIDLTSEQELAGPGIVHHLSVELPADPAALRRDSIRITVDGERCVDSPLGDFFGTGPGLNPGGTIAVGIKKDGTGFCQFPMPFEKSFKVETGGAPVSMGVQRSPVRLPPLRFHAFWRSARDIPTRPPSHWNVLNAKGRGRFVGCALTVRNPVRNWWGEGDEKFYVDGEEFPSIFGTGTEDYFGFAWCSPQLFSAPYHAQTRCDGPLNHGYTSCARHHVLDDVPFEKSLRFDLEILHQVETKVDFSTVAYWYAEPGSTHDFEETDPADREARPLPPLEIPSVAGAIEGETIEVVGSTSGVAVPQDLSWSKGFSGEAHLWWRDASPGGVLRLRFESPAAGPGRLLLALTKAGDYGKVKFRLNGEPMGGEVDLYSPEVVPSGEIAFENAPLKKGANILEVEITGTNPKARPKNFMFGLDYLKQL